MWWLLACAPKVDAPLLTWDAEGVANEVATDGAVESRVSDVPAELVLFYGGEHHGSMETCGCPESPKGSLARMASYLDAASGDNTVLLHGGYFLSDLTNTDLTLRGDVPALNRWMVQGLRQLPWDALHVTANDLAGLGDVDTTGLPLVSLNVTGPGIAPWVIVRRAGKDVGITGVTGTGLAFDPPAAYTIKPAEDTAAQLAALAAQTDVVVLSVFSDPDAARFLRSVVPDIDVIVDVGHHRDALPATRLGRTLWVFSPYETQRVGELRLDLTNNRALDRKIDLDPQIPARADLEVLRKKARAEVAAVQAELFAP